MPVFPLLNVALDGVRLMNRGVLEARIRLVGQEAVKLYEEELSSAHASVPLLGARFDGV